MKGESPKFASLVYPCYIMWKLFEGKGRCVVFILFKINNVFHVRLWFVLLPKQLLSVSFCGWFTVALTFATKQLYIISTVRKFPIPSIPIKETLVWHFVFLNIRKQICWQRTAFYFGCWHDTKYFFFQIGGSRSEVKLIILSKSTWDDESQDPSSGLHTFR